MNALSSSRPRPSMLIWMSAPERILVNSPLVNWLPCRC